MTLYYFLGATGWPASGSYVGQVVQPLYNYTTNAGTISITGLSEAGSTVILPSSINGLPVTVIGDEAFFQSSVANVLIPGTVTSIGDLAFYGSTNLTSLTLPGSVTNIRAIRVLWLHQSGQPSRSPASPPALPMRHFMAGTSLTNLTLTEGVTSLGDLLVLWLHKLGRPHNSRERDEYRRWGFWRMHQPDQRPFRWQPSRRWFLMFSRVTIT